MPSIRVYIPQTVCLYVHLIEFLLFDMRNHGDRFPLSCICRVGQKNSYRTKRDHPQKGERNHKVLTFSRSTLHTVNCLPNIQIPPRLKLLHNRGQQHRNIRRICLFRHLDNFRRGVGWEEEEEEGKPDFFCAIRRGLPPVLTPSCSISMLCNTWTFIKNW